MNSYFLFNTILYGLKIMENINVLVFKPQLWKLFTPIKRKLIVFAILYFLVGIYW